VGIARRRWSRWERLWGEVRAFAREPVPVPVGLTERIMSRISALIARMAGSIVLIRARGDAYQRARGCPGRACRRADVPGVALPSVRWIGVDPRERSRVRLGLRLVIAFGPSIDALASAVRAQVSARVSAQTGARIAGVDIAVEDIISDS
jgi:hypothetical protein